MALSNSQYDQLMRDYEQLQLDNEHELRLRFDEVYAKIQIGRASCRERV